MSLQEEHYNFWIFIGPWWFSESLTLAIIWASALLRVCSNRVVLGFVIRESAYRLTCRFHRRAISARLFSGILYDLFWLLGPYCFTIKPEKYIHFPRGSLNSLWPPTTVLIQDPSPCPLKTQGCQVGRACFCQPASWSSIPDTAI